MNWNCRAFLSAKGIFWMILFSLRRCTQVIFKAHWFLFVSTHNISHHFFLIQRFVLFGFIGNIHFYFWILERRSFDCDFKLFLLSFSKGDCIQRINSLILVSEFDYFWLLIKRSCLRVREKLPGSFFKKRLWLFFIWCFWHLNEVNNCNWL